jgi:hypothetical protein
MNSFDMFIETLKDALHEIIPMEIKDETDFRFTDNLRPMIYKEREFFKMMKLKEFELSKSSSKFFIFYIVFLIHRG